MQQSLTGNNISTNVHMRRKMTKRMGNILYAMCILFTNFNNFHFTFVYFVLNESANFM